MTNIHTIALIPGDGIGKEITEAVKEVGNALGSPIAWDEVVAGQDAIDATGELIPKAVYDAIDTHKVALKGPVATPIGEGFRSVNVSLRKHYQLHTNIRPIRILGQIPALHRDVDIVLFRENTEDLYAGVEEQISPDEAHSIKIITRQATERIVTAAFEYAVANDRKKVAIVTKANIMKLSDGLFLKVAREIAAKYPQIEATEVLVDNMAMQLVMRPQQYDVVVTENLYGDILSDLMAGLIGGLGLVPGANLGDDVAIFEAVHGSAPDIAGQGIANPTAILLAFADLLDHISLQTDATRLRDALDTVLSDASNFTRDLGGELTTAAFTDKVIAALA
ncbi:isocitrate/isopropylmalate dehydrogenase family protein [Aerococcus viridans]|uniref:Isocitrate dehydrogenase n=1 Tax=Aerococcus viridans TaxID=1377 RepID=A0A2J9PMN8_9LACT|nr:isocitrate/isopropylmalate dehydrogenase family protein [Aerococcus viridans]PNL91577.1 isocitrate dehydrogenase [Aerococcus viridans]